MLGCTSPCIHLIWIFLSFLDLDICFLPQIRKIFSPISSNNFSHYLSLFFFFQDSYNGNIVPLMLSHRSLIKVYLLLKFFFHFAAVWISFIVLFSSCLIHSSFLSHLLLNASIAFFSSLITCWLSIIYFFVKFLIVLIHSSSEFSEHTHKNIYFRYVFGCD